MMAHWESVLAGSHLFQASTEAESTVPERLDAHGTRVCGDEEPSSCYR